MTFWRFWVKFGQFWVKFHGFGVKNITFLGQIWSNFVDFIRLVNERLTFIGVSTLLLNAFVNSVSLCFSGNGLAYIIHRYDS